MDCFHRQYPSASLALLQDPGLCSIINQHGIRTNIPLVGFSGHHAHQARMTTALGSYHSLSPPLSSSAGGYSSSSIGFGTSSPIPSLNDHSRDGDLDYSSSDQSSLMGVPIPAHLSPVRPHKQLIPEVNPHFVGRLSKFTGPSSFITPRPSASSFGSSAAQIDQYFAAPGGSSRGGRGRVVHDDGGYDPRHEPPTFATAAPLSRRPPGLFARKELEGKFSVPAHLAPSVPTAPERNERTIRSQHSTATTTPTGPAHLLENPVISNRNYQEARYKTELCLHYREKNNCPHGSACLFAHGLGELRPYRGRHPKHKTLPCKSFHESGYCNYGYRCSYIHLESPRTIHYIKSLNEEAQKQRRFTKQTFHPQQQQQHSTRQFYQRF